MNGSQSTPFTPGGTLEVNYSVTSGDNVSAIICDSYGNILYYATKTPDGTGKWTMTLPSDLSPANSYTLKVFSEQLNGDYNTDYASTPAEITLNSAYTVSCSTAGHGSVTANPTSAAENTKITLTVTPDEDYELQELTVTYLDGGETKTITPTKDTADETGKTYTFIMPGANVTVSATFKEIAKYDITVSCEPEAGGSASATLTSGASGQEVSLTAAPNNGYRFKEWQVIPDNVTITDNKFNIGTEDIQVKAVFEPISYTVTYDLDGGSGETSKIYTIESADTLPKPTKGGSTFNGWKVTTARGNWTADQVLGAGTALTGQYGDVTLTALWDQNGISVAEIQSQTYTGNIITPAITVTDIISGTTLTAVTDYTVSYDKEGTAITELKDAGTYTVTVTGTGGYTGKTVSTPFVVNKAVNPAMITETATVTVGGNTVDLSANVSNAEGTVNYTISGETNECTLNGSILTSGTTAGTCTVTVTVAGNENYESKTGNITVTVTGKKTETLSVTQSGTIYGTTLAEPAYSAPTGSTLTISYSGTLRSGSSYGPTATKPTEAGNYTVTVTAETNDTVYSGSATFTIEPAVPDVGTVTADDVTGTMEASAVVLKRSDESVPGTLKLTETKLVCGTNTYNWTFTPTDANNYMGTSGTVVINVAHDWGETTYTWAGDNSSVTATRICKNNAEHKETETVKTTTAGNAATCESAGKITYTATFENQAFETQTKTVEEAALGHIWTVCGTEWASDYSSITVKFVCSRDASHTRTVTEQATASVSGSKVTYTATVEGVTYTETIDISGEGYVFTQATQIWVKGSAEGATFRVTRLGDDSWTYSLFTGLTVDGSGASYDKAPGSIIITLRPAWLNSLSVGWHRLTVYFTDGKAETDFLVLAAGGGSGGSSYYSASSGERYTYVPPSNNPRTGDESNLALWGALAIISLVGATLTVRIRKKESGENG